jgi:hypothetical protein
MGGGAAALLALVLLRRPRGAKEARRLDPVAMSSR